MGVIIAGPAERKLGRVLAIGIAAAMLVAAVPSSAASNPTAARSHLLPDTAHQQLEIRLELLRVETEAQTALAAVERLIGGDL